MNRRDFLKQAAAVGGLALTQPWQLVNGLYTKEAQAVVHPKRIIIGWQHTGSRPDFEALYGWRYLLFRHWHAYVGLDALWVSNLTLPDAAWYPLFAAGYRADTATHKDKILIFDHEAWPAPTDNSGASAVIRQATAAMFVTLYNGLKAVLPEYLIGFYSFPMNRDFFRARQSQASQAYLDWQACNDDYATMWQAVDIIFPTLYFFWNRWEIHGGEQNVPDAYTYFSRNIGEARRCTQVHGRNQPIVPYVWNRRQDDGTVLGPGTLSSVGTAVTTSATHFAQPDIYALITNGAQSGQSRRVAAVTGANTFTLETAYTVDQTGRTWNRVEEVGAELDVDIWRLQCRTAYLEGDGLITFGGFTVPWDENEWWWKNFRQDFPFGDRQVVKPKALRVF